MANARIDILGLGVSTIDDLLMVKRFPRVNEKQEIVSSTRQCGGLTGSALVAAARLGCRCGHVISLGEGELSSFLRREMVREGISLLERSDCPDAEPYHSIIITEEPTGERSILWDDAKSLPPHIGKKEMAMAAEAGCLFVDHIYAEQLLEIAAAARQAGTPVVGDFERSTPGGQELMDLTDHLIIPLDYAKQLLGETVSAESAVRMLARRPGRALVCITDGAHGAWYALGDHPEQVMHQPIFRMDCVVDSTGCGDVFHGAYAAGIVKGWPPAERIRRAAAASALKTQKPGAQAGAPTLSQLETFLLDAVESSGAE